VVDDAGSVRLVLRSGSSRDIPDGSWIVNCTGYVLRDRQDYEPYASASGRVVSIQPRSAAMHLTSYAGYFLTHLMFLGRLDDVPLYELDVTALRAKSATALPFAVLTLAQYNLSLIADAVPAAVLRDCGLDFDRWYPWPRRAVASARFMLSHRRARTHRRRTLDTLAQRFDVRCGTLAEAAAQ